LCFVLRFMLGDRKRIAPQSEHVVTAGRRSSLAATGLALLTVASLDLMGADNANAAASDPRVTYNDATTAYQQGDYATAKEGLQASLVTDDLTLQNRGYYNLGNTLFREGSQSIQSKPEETVARWEESIKAYKGAIALDPTDADAQFNRNLVQKKLDALKQRQEEQKKQEDQQKQDQQKQDQTKEPTSTKQDSKESKPGEPGKEEPGKEEDKTESSDQQPSVNKQGEPSEEKPAQPEKTGSATQAGDPKSDAQEQAEAAPAGERRNPGEMTEREAAQLLDSLKDDEDNVVFAPARQQGRFRDPDNTTNGKDW
jgi:Ca-activated chloride channel homolog